MISNKNHRIPCHTLSKQFKKAANNSNDFQTLCKNQRIPCHTLSKQFKKAANNSNDFQTLCTIFKHLLSWMIHQIQIISNNTVSVKQISNSFDTHFKCSAPSSVSRVYVSDLCEQRSWH